MKKKVKGKDGKIFEVEANYILKEGEEEVPEAELEPDPEEEKIMKGFEKIVGEKIELALKDIHENPVKKSQIYRKEDPTEEKSVIETDPYLRSKRPFVKLSKAMEDFIVNVRAVARGGIVKALGEDTDTAGGFLVPDKNLSPMLVIA